MIRTRPLVARARTRRVAGPLAVMLSAVLSAALVTLPAAALTPEQLQTEQRACLERSAGAVENPEQACTCMVEGLAESLSDADYAALAALLAGGAATPEGEAAHATAKQVVAQCLGG